MLQKLKITKCSLFGAPILLRLQFEKTSFLRQKENIFDLSGREYAFRRKPKSDRHARRKFARKLALADVEPESRRRRCI